MGVEDEASEVFEGVVAAEEFMAEPAEEFGVGDGGFFPIAGLVDEAAAHELLPEAVGHDLGEAFVLRGGDEGGEKVAGIGWFFGELMCEVGVEEFFERPGRSNFGTGRESDFDERFTASGGEAVERDAGSFWNGERLAGEEGGELEEVCLESFVRGRIVAAGALHFDAKEGGADDEAFGGHGDVVLGGEAEAGGAAEFLGTFHADEFGDHEVEGFFIDEGFVEPEAEGAGVVEGWVKDVGVFAKDVLKVSHPTVSPARIGEEAVDGEGASAFFGVVLESGDLVEGGWDADGVEGEAAKEGKVVGEFGEVNAVNVELGPGGTLSDPLSQKGEFNGGDRVAFGRHFFVGVIGCYAMDESGVFEVAGGDGGAVEFAAFESSGEGREVEVSFGFLALVTGEAAVFEDGENGLVEIEVVGLVVLELGRDGLDAGVEEVVDGVLGWESVAGFGNRVGCDPCEVITGGLAAFLPVGGVFFTKDGAADGVGFFNPGEVVFFESGKVLVGVGDFVFGWSEEVPIGGVLEGNGGDEFAGFGSVSG